ncbi:hypothetical protein RJ639_022037 [Escallonia herrerae]|uniref:RING-type E3 ubiquitin transferase n=1 Tax=Escallonia herrerae TaxID=1293975 RepID=A0AA88V666_9ASTE|nr:hypothetical protein RJ639_022037 [Escallonia herrerae]
MGISLSTGNNSRRRNHPPSQLFHSYDHRPGPYLYPAQPPPPPPPPPQPPIYSSDYYSRGYPACNYANPMMGGGPHLGPHYNYHINGWAPVQPATVVVAPAAARYVDHQHAKQVKNDVNVHKHTLRLEVDEQNPDHHLVCFDFDAVHDGSISIFYFAKEELDCMFVPVFPEAYVPVKVPFQKGHGQKFRQPSGTGIDLGFFELNDLSKPSPGEDVFPLVISAETCGPSSSTDEHLTDLPTKISTQKQITQAVLEKKNGEPFTVRVIKQILWIEGNRYELREIFGIGSSSEGLNDGDSGKECIICMTEPKDTAVLPCRHMCMCSECAKELRLQSNTCPICRQPIEELMEIKINNVNE